MPQRTDAGRRTAAHRSLRSVRRCCVGLILLAFGAPRVSAAENWPQWRGSKNDGVSSDTNVPVEWSRDHNIAWRLALPGPAGSTPIVWKDRIFLTSADQADLLLLCISTD